jgi:acyltransferase
MNRKRIVYMDVYRGLAMLFVIISHVIDANFISSFNMPVFLFASGFFLKPIHKEKNISIIKTFVKKNQVLIYSYILYSLLLCLGSIRILRLLVTNVWLTLTLNGIGTLWYISTLILGSFITTLLLQKFSKRTVLFISVLLLIVVYFTGLYLQSDLFKTDFGRLIYYIITSIVRPCSFVFFLSISYFSKDFILTFFNKLSSLKIESLLFLISTALLLWLSSYVGHVDMHIMLLGNLPIFIMTSCIGCIMLLSLSKLINRFTFPTKVFEYIGTNTIFIMVTHYTILPFIRVENALYTFFLIILIELVSTYIIGERIKLFISKSVRKG